MIGVNIGLDLLGGSEDRKKSRIFGPGLLTQYVGLQGDAKLTPLQPLELGEELQECFRSSPLDGLSRSA
jgi:hypothetical protein